MIKFLYNRRIRAIISDSVDIQRKVLRKILEKNSGSRFGLEHQFGSIKSYEAFSARVGLREYEEIYDYLSRAGGVENTLTCEKTNWAALTSGTSSKQKTIPVSKRFLKRNHYSVGRLAVLHMMYRCGFPKLFRGKTLGLSGYSYDFDVWEKPAIDISALIISQLPPFFRYHNYPNESFQTWDSKIDHLVRDVKSMQNTRAIAGIPTWILAFFEEVSRRFQKDPKEIFPKLDLFVHGGMDCRLYKDVFRKIFYDRRVFFFETYNMTEGFVGFQYEREKPDLLLVTDSWIFYEFRDINDETVVPLSAIAPGSEYEIIITTLDGLYRYHTGDVVRFSSKNPFLFTILGRTTESMNVFGEHLSMAHINVALEKLKDRLSFEILDYFVVPSQGGLNESRFHQWHIEFKREPEVLADFEIALDQLLKECSTSYEQKREGDIGMSCLRVQRLAKGTLSGNWRKRVRMTGQLKPKKLFPDRSIIKVLDDFSSDNTNI